MKRGLVFILILAAIGVLAVFWWAMGISAANPKNKTVQNFVVAKGAGIKEITLNLRSAGLIRDQVVFFLLVKRLGIEKNIQAGSFKLSPSLTAPEIAQKLTVGTEDVWLTIPEGWRAEEILEYLNDQKIDSGNWTMAAELKTWKTNEGIFFPDTYLVPKQISVTGVHDLMLKTFQGKFTDQLEKDARAEGLTKQQVIILASLVEREARTDMNRAKVADVLLKRFKDGVSLDVDATVQYIVGKQPNGSWWKLDLTLEDLAIKSPFNTYKNAGLPPAPICNPGLSSIKAVIYPDKNPYYYYITDKQGVMHYAVTLQEHNQNIAKYL